mgnify:CR=1 FL=1
MTKKHLLTILFIVLSAIILVSCSNTQAVVSEKSTTTLPSAESTSVTESTTVNTTVQKTDNASAESKATKTTNTETAKASTNKPTSPNTKADKAVQNTTKPTTTSKQPTTQKASQCSNNNNHSMKCGNMGRWFDSKSDVKAYVDSVMKSWADKWESGELSDDEYFANCPQGYECWSCGYCGKWTGNFK